MMRTMLLRFFRPGLGRRCTVISPSRAASLTVSCASFLQTPARAAISARERSHVPLANTSSPTMRRTASSPTVNWHASAGGIGPDAARRRLRSIDRLLSGDLCSAALRKARGAFCRFAGICGLGNGNNAPCATPDSPRRLCRRSARPCAASSGMWPAAWACQS